MEVKEYREVLDLARGVVATTIRETADGFQVKDLMPIISDNMQKTLVAYEGVNLISVEWKENPEECMFLTVDFAIDTAMDVLKVPAGTPSEFKETKELVVAISGITSSVIAHMPGGIQGAEIIPIVFENFNGIIVGLDGLDKVRGEFNADARSYVKMLATSAIKLAFQVKKAMDAKPVA